MRAYSRRGARRSLFLTIAFRALSQVATLAGYVVLVRSMTEHSFGVFMLLYSIIPVISTSASLGIEQTVRRFQPEYLRAGKDQLAAWLVRFAGRARLLSNLVLLTLLLLLWEWIAPIFGLGPYRQEFALFGILAVLYFQAGVLQLSLASHMLQGYSVGMTVILSVSKVIAYLVFVQFGGLTLTHAIVADSVAFALMYLGLRVTHDRLCRPASAGQPVEVTKDERRRLLRYSLFNNFNDAGAFVLGSKSDNFFIAAVVNPIAVGTYAFYTRLNEMTAQLMPYGMFSNVIHPLFFAVPRDEAAVKVPQFFTLIINITMLIQLPIAVIFTAYHHEIVQLLFGGKFIEYSWLLALIVWFAAINRVGAPVTMVAQYEEKASIILYSKFAAIHNVIALLALVRVMGVYGAAIATGTAQMLKNGYLWWHVRRHARWLNLRALAGTSILIWGTCLAVCFGMKALVPNAPVFNLLFGVVACVLALLVQFRTPALSKSDRQILRDVFHGREARVLQRLGIIRRPVTP